ncbi:MAG: non-canonical purine NTP pyrophosphatase [Patescibacteria group bacterium]
MQSLLLATKNRGKVIEMRECLADLPCEILTLEDLTESLILPPEESDTFEGNARDKARFCFKRTGIPSLADDSGILVEALKAELGIHTRRWGAGPDASDEEWITLFLERMRQEKNKRAEFVCVLALIDEEGEEHFFEGHCTGVITDALEAEYLPGLPISACFQPEGYDRVFSVLTIEEKNRVSHRGRAMQELRKFLQGMYPRVK